MKRSAIPRACALIIAAVLTHLPATASACTVCMGDPNSKAAGAINAAIFLMIGCIGFMLSSLGGFAFYLARRANAPVPPHVELGQSIPEPDDLT